VQYAVPSASPAVFNEKSTFSWVILIALLGIAWTGATLFSRAEARSDQQERDIDELRANRREDLKARQETHDAIVQMAADIRVIKESFGGGRVRAAKGEQ
jgi:hypothetical protein